MKSDLRRMLIKYLETSIDNLIQLRSTLDNNQYKLLTPEIENIRTVRKLLKIDNNDYSLDKYEV